MATIENDVAVDTSYEYNVNGKLVEKDVFQRDFGNRTEYLYDEGKRYAMVTYQSDKPATAVYYDRTGKEISKQEKISKGTKDRKLYNLDGGVFREFSMVDGKVTGQVKNYNDFGSSSR